MQRITISRDQAERIAFKHRVFFDPPWCGQLQELANNALLLGTGAKLAASRSGTRCRYMLLGYAFDGADLAPYVDTAGLAPAMPL